MKKTALLLLTAFLFTGCFNKHGVSAKYYSDCEEYYDYQGYYHKECGKDDIVTYEEAGEATGKATRKVVNATKDAGGKVVDTAKDVGEAVYDYIK
ncbi:MAG: hypothetical protein NTW78_11245 [Campylobacterales bacterium]|nr:hypothetical protein [Campylobacterales bacterium]